MSSPESRRTRTAALARAWGPRMRYIGDGGVRAGSDQSRPQPQIAPGYDRDGRKTEPTLQEEAHNPRSPHSMTGCIGIFESQNCIAGCSLRQFRAALGELQTQYTLEWELGRQQQRASFAGPEINERIVFKSNIEACQNMLEAHRFDSSIVIPFNPVRAGNVEIAEIGPSSEPAIRVNTIFPVKLAGLQIRTQRLSCTVLSKKMNRQKKAPAKTGHETALPQRLLNSGD